MKCPCRRYIRVLLFLLASLVICQDAPLIAQVSINQAELVQLLTSASPKEQMTALVQLRTIPSDQRDRFVLPALLRALDSQVGNFRQRLNGQRMVIDPFESEALNELLVAVDDYNDPIVLRSILPFMNHGTIVAKMVGKFGELAIRDVVAIAESPYDANELAGALNVLKYILEN